MDADVERNTSDTELNVEPQTDEKEPEPSYGVESEIAFAKNPCYEEPKEPPPRPPCCTRRFVNPDLPRADGYSLGSNRRMHQQRAAGVHYPPGPRDRFRFPVTTSMDYGWALVDPLLEGTHFLCAQANHRHVSSDLMKNVHERLKDGSNPAQLWDRLPIPLADLGVFHPHELRASGGRNTWLSEGSRKLRRELALYEQKSRKRLKAEYHEMYKETLANLHVGGMKVVSKEDRSSMGGKRSISDRKSTSDKRSTSDRWSMRKSRGEQ